MLTPDKGTALIATIDAGTTGIKCIIFDTKGEIVSSSYAESRTFYPKPGWVEQDANEVISLAFFGMKNALSGTNVDLSKIVGLCITAQRNTWVPIDKDGNFLTHMFIWQDQRGEEVIPWMRKRLNEYGLTEDDFYRIIGQPFSTFQPGSKTFWFRINMPDVYQKTWKFVTPHDFLSHEFGASEYTDSICDISSWMVTDGKNFKFDPALMNVFGMDADKYTQHVTPGTCIGKVSHEASVKSGLPEGLPIFSASGDQECGVLGVGNYGIDGTAIVSTGTAGNVIGYSEVCPRHPDRACQVHGHPAGGYTIEAHSSSCTSSFQWLRDIVAAKEQYLNTNSFENPYAVISKMILTSNVGANGVLFLPWLQGAGCPYFDDSARGGLIGISLSTKKEDLLRACVEGICFDMHNLLDTLEESQIAPISRLKVFGGTSRDPVWNQIMADVMGKPVETLTATEATALGAAITGFVGAGIFDSYKQAVKEMCHAKEVYVPDKQNTDTYKKLYTVWNQCYNELARKIYPEIHKFQKENY